MQPRTRPATGREAQPARENRPPAGDPALMRAHQDGSPSRRSDAGHRQGRRTPWRDPSRSSPASGPTCRSRRSAGSPPSGATTGWRSPAGATTSRSTRRSPTTPTSTASGRRSPSTTCRSSRSPTTWSARRSATTRSTSGTRASCPPAIWGDGEPEGVRQRAAEEMKDTARAAAKLGVRHRRRVHRLVDLAHRWRCSRRCRRSMIERGYAGLRRPVEPDPRRLRRGRACGSRTRCTPARSRTTTGRPSARWRRSATGPRSASTGTRRTSCGRSSTR